MRVSNVTITPISAGFPIHPGLRPQLRMFRADGLNVVIAPDRKVMGQAAAYAFEQQVVLHLKSNDDWAGIFASAPSQDDVSAELTSSATMPWNRLRGYFQMDEYIGMPGSNPRSFMHYASKHYWGPLLSAGTGVDPQVFHPMRGDAKSIKNQCAHYASLLDMLKPKFVQGGIGEENAHIAFNDPPYAKFNDPKRVKVVPLVEACVRQQKAEGHFRADETLPKALTLTVPALTRGIKYWSCTAPTTRKATAVEKLVFGPVTEDVPATILRTAGTDTYGLSDMTAALFLDMEAARLIIPRIDQLMLGFASRQ